MKMSHQRYTRFPAVLNAKIPRSFEGGSSGGGGAGSSEGAGGGAETVTVAQVNDIVSKALGARFRERDEREEKARKEFQAQLLDAVGAKLGETLDEALPGQLEKLGLKPGSKPPADNKVDITDDMIRNHPLFKGLSKDMENQKSKLTELDAERKAEKAAARDAKLRAQVLESLTEMGIDGARAKHALHYLVDGEKSVRYQNDESNTIVFRDGEDDIDLKTGLTNWAKTEDGKLYLPPRGAGGSGGRGAEGGSGNQRSADDPSKSKTALGNGLAAHLGIPLG